LNIVISAIICLCAVIAALVLYLSRRHFSSQIMHSRTSQARIEALESRLLQQELLVSLTQSFISLEEPGVLIRNALMMLVMSMKAGRATLSCINRETQTLTIDHEWSDPKQKLKPLTGLKINFVSGNIFYDTFVITGDVCLTCDKSEDSIRIMQTMGLTGLKGAVYVPVNIYGKFWGILGIEQYNDEHSLIKSDSQILKLAADAVASLLIRAEAEKILVLSKEQAEISNQAKTYFLSRMSHEMRTPLNAVIGMTTIARNSNDQDKMEYCLNKINEASLHLLGVINDILDMSKIEAGKFELSTMEFDFIRMIKRVTDMFGFKANEKHQTLHIKLDPSIPRRIVADEQRLAQVLTNLLSNAIKFTPEEGNITLSVQMAENSDRRCTILFNVIDSGIGITEEQREHLFSPFEQADGSISRRFGGTGLGLSITKNIVELMGGEIWIKSEPGKGSTFAFELSFEQGKPVQNKVTGKIAWEKLRILVVDDSREVLEYFMQYAEQNKMQCTTAEDGIQACKLMEKSEEPLFDIAFIDWKMPNMSGTELCKKIKERFDKKICVIMISASEWDIIEEEAKDAGVDCFIPKPLFSTVITETIERLLAETGKTSTEKTEDSIENIFTGHSILVAEDVEINREIILSILEETGVTIDFADNGKTAYDLFGENPEKYEMILMDIHMPEMDGYETTTKIRALNNKGKNVPIVAMTANVFKDDIEKCLARGMNDHLGKPVDFEELFKRLKKYLLNKDN